MTQYETIVAAFRPGRTDNLVRGAETCIGLVDRWMAAWLIEDGEYRGQWAMQPESQMLPFGWTPECDLERVPEG